MVLQTPADRARSPSIASLGIAPEFVASYREHWQHSDPWMHRGVVNEGVWRTEEILGHQELVRSDFFAHWLRPQNLGQGVRAVIDVNDRDRWIVTLLRMRQMPGVEDGVLTSLRAGFPLIRSAARLTCRVEHVQAERDAVIDVLEQLTFGAILLDRRGKILAINGAANEIAARTGAFVADHRGVRPARASDNQRLMQVIDRLSEPRAARPARRPERVALPIRGTSGALPLTVIVSQLKTATGESDREPVVAIFMADPNAAQVDIPEERLVSLYGLSRPEARLAVRLVQGLTLEEIADELRISIHTVRVYLKQIFTKTNVHRQSALVRLLVSGAPQVRAALIALTSALCAGA
jgi:DNA-binding CsgD family transcriptional regulator